MSSFLQILLQNSSSNYNHALNTAGEINSESSSRNIFSDPSAFFTGESTPSCGVKCYLGSTAEGSDAPPRYSKRTRAAEVHNLTEKRRRSRINEKLKALQTLIPNSNKTDKASMLDEAIEYLKKLQLQFQMLTVRNGLSLHPGSLQSMLAAAPAFELEGSARPNTNVHAPVLLASSSMTNGTSSHVSPHF